VSNNIPADECGKATITFFDKTGHVLWQKTNESLYILECNVSDDGERTLLFLECFQDNRFFCVCNKKGQEISKIENPTMVFPNLDNSVIYYTLLNDFRVVCINYQSDTTWMVTPSTSQPQMLPLKTGKYIFIIDDKQLKVYNSLGKVLWSKKDVEGIFTCSENDDKTLIFYYDKVTLYDNLSGFIFFNLSGIKYKNHTLNFYSAFFLSKFELIALTSLYDENHIIFTMLGFDGKVKYTTTLQCKSKNVKDVQLSDEHTLTVKFKDDNIISQKIELEK